MRFSVVISTYNRARIVPHAVRSVLDQQGVEFELIVVDDGSSDDTAKVLGQIGDPRLKVVRRPNGGFSVARNTGIEAATGEWVTFLDDDDMALPGWLSCFAEMAGRGVGVVCCAAEYRSREGALVEIALPGADSLFDNRTALFLAGTFAVQADLLRSVGGFDERLACSQNTDLGLRLMSGLVDHDLEIRSSDRPCVRLEHRPASDRPSVNPAVLFQGTRVLLDNHRERLARDPHGRAVLNGVLGVSAAKLGRWQDARSALFTSVRAEPLELRHWLRFGFASVPPLGRRVWGSVERPA
jgi:glycosyltransferase involved in cell wall biosynthesis